MPPRSDPLNLTGERKQTRLTYMRGSQVDPSNGQKEGDSRAELYMNGSADCLRTVASIKVPAHRDSSGEWHACGKLS